jgi:trehalose-6-phosphate synthase
MGASPLTFREDAMGYFDTAQARTFKIEDKNEFSDDDVKWIKSIVNVSVVTKQKKSIRVFTETEDAIPGIITSINKKYCNMSHPKLTPLFSVLD